MHRRHFLGAMAFGAAHLKWPVSRLHRTRIAFGSCLLQDQPQPIWRGVQSVSPDLFVFLGDNIYGDTEDMTLLSQRYRQFGENAEFVKFRKQVPLAATWDDHDLGCNDAGREYPEKEASKKLMLDFFGEPEHSPRRFRPGVYTSLTLGPPDRRVQILLLDLRWFRSPLVFRDGTGYVPNPDPSAELLGEHQWQWLEAELRKPAAVRILASSIQLASGEHRWEKWANFPYELNRLLNLLDRLAIDNLVAISGDMHFGELSQIERPSGKLLWDITSSGLNRFESARDIPNSRRVAVYDRGSNFGSLDIAWTQSPRISAYIHNEKGEPVCQTFDHIG